MAGISTENKISVTVCLIIAIALVVYVFSTPSSNSLISGGSSGQVDINVNTSTSNIDLAKDSDENLLESEVIAEVYEKGREQKLKEAQSGGDSYIAKLDLANDEQISSEIVDDERHIRNQEKIDDILNIDDEIKINKEKAEIERRKKELALEQSAPATTPVQPQVPQKEAFYFDKKAFLAGELQGRQKQDQTTRNQQNQAVTQLTTHSKADIVVAGSYAGGNGASSSYKGNRTGNSASDGSATGRLKNGSYSAMIEQGKQNKFDEMNRLRAANGGITNKPNNNNNSSTSNSEAYIEMTDPAGFQDNSSSEYITAGTIYYAILEIGVNTDEISPVRATIIQEGPVKGGILLGTPERRGSKAVIAFNSMSLDGKDYSVTGVALDLETMRTGIADSVDHHTFERYSKLMGAAFISGYAESLSNTSTKTYSDGSTEKIVDAIPETEDQIAYAIGQAGEKLVPIFEDEFNKEPTVEVDSNREIAIMFMSGFEVGENAK